MKGVWNLSTDSCMRCGCVDHFVCGLWTLSGLSGHWRRSTVQLPAQRGSCRGAAVRGRYRTVLIQPACEPPLKYPLIQRSSASLSRALVGSLYVKIIIPTPTLEDRRLPRIAVNINMSRRSHGTYKTATRAYAQRTSTVYKHMRHIPLNRNTKLNQRTTKETPC